MPGERGRRRVVIASLATIAVAVLLGAFLLGTRMRAAAAPARPAAPAPMAPARGTTAAPEQAAGQDTPGVRRWDALTGGECLRTFGSPWRLRYPVVACRAAHAAQLTRRLTLTGTEYPDRGALRARLGSTCDDAVRRSAAARYPDLRVTSAYPTAARWAAGDRSAYCFVFRAGGGALVGSLAAG